MGRLKEEEIEKMIRDAQKYAEADRKAKVCSNRCMCIQANIPAHVQKIAVCRDDAIVESLRRMLGLYS
jgi:hypothetical protein